MRMIVAGVSLLLLAACPGGKPNDVAQDEAARKAALIKEQSEYLAAPAPAEAPRANVIPLQGGQPPAYVQTDMSPTDSMPACRAGLKAKGLNDAELDIMLGPMAGVCPNNGVSEGRIREILTTVWTQAGCHQHGPVEVARALDSGACGGDAG